MLGTLEICLRLDGCFNLKEKRRVLRSLLDRARRDYRVAVAEVDDCDLWNSAVIGVAVVSNEVSQVESVLSKVTELFELCPDVEVETAGREIART